ncbi:MAG: hypothetical protein D3924_19120 [Candidatus Electrothrix sp. AR4]|nr:hypothetical protein [Candidatus Electrothrix sp. AR4]
MKYISRQPIKPATTFFEEEQYENKKIAQAERDHLCAFIFTTLIYRMYFTVQKNGIIQQGNKIFSGLPAYLGDYRPLYRDDSWTRPAHGNGDRNHYFFQKKRINAAQNVLRDTV